ncbi:MAG: mechanosensitive ion channel family protein [Methylotetracoccus sp.]
MRALRAVLTVLVCAALLGAGQLPAMAADSAPERASAAKSDQKTAAVEVDGRVLFRLRGVSSMPADERAANVAVRIKGLARAPTFDPASLVIEQVGDYFNLMAGAERVLVVTKADGEIEEVGAYTLATAYVERIRSAIVDYRRERSRDFLVQSAISASVATLALAAALTAIVWIRPRLRDWMLRRMEGRVRSLGIQSFEILGANRLRDALIALLNTLLLIAGLALVLAFVGFTTQLFPWTRSFGSAVYEHTTGPLHMMAGGTVTVLPDLAFLAILWIVVRVVLRLVRLFFEAVGDKAVRFASFEPEWAEPTYKLVRLAIVAFALVVAYPFIPGAGTDAFKGVSLFVGVLLSLGSTSAIANLIAGYMMTFRRAFHHGDRIQVGDVTGEVTERRLQVTHLRTPKNEEVIIPNSTLLNSHVVNLSSLAARDGLILHTTVGIGYETPWRQVEAMLLMAARRTAGIEKEPAPYVLQRSLGDFCIVYEINVFTRSPRTMEQTYSNLHRNILDVFNEYGVQIMTPAYEGDPHEPKLVPREQWFAPPASVESEIAKPKEGASAP